MSPSKRTFFIIPRERLSQNILKRLIRGRKKSTKKNVPRNIKKKGQSTVVIHK